ncbi:MAG: vitamin B12-dependent ribonucleotide reductase [Bdellovibrionales bacterium]|nr:vitamin B12-dependent ribonucleotide reductase [Bdellovibrionales bacterium]
MKRSKGKVKKQSSRLVSRYFTKGGGVSPLKSGSFVRAHSVIREPGGRVVFERKDIEVPEGWSQLAIDILASKYMRRVGVPKTGQEVSVKQVIARITGSLKREAIRTRILTPAEARIFEEELQYLLLHQIAAFNSPVWFNLGLHQFYGISGSGGNFRFDPRQKRVLEVQDNFKFPQTSACFIQSVEDDLMDIFDLVKSEARLFKYGSGTGTNFSSIRGRQEKLSGGGTSSGLLSFLEVLDRGAGATKSGGTTRRAAKMVCLDSDHPEILEFIRWKKLEEEKARALIREGYPADFNGEAYRTVSGQNSNNSVRLSDEFMEALLQGKSWALKARTTGEVISEIPAQVIWKEIAESAWFCADPGIQFDSTINAWHTCAASGPIRASNPCSEFMFLDDTACNLASINLLKFLSPEGRFDFDGFAHSVRTLILAQELLVGLSSYPTPEIAKRSHEFRPLGLGYANLGALLMVKGFPYDSDEGRALAAGVTAFMTAEAYAMSAELSKASEPFQGYGKNKSAMRRVLARHQKAANHIPYEMLEPVFKERVSEAWERALKSGISHGYRNSQVTVLAPTGTIGLLMDCDTTGIEPDFALVKFKKLAGGGSFKMVNQSIGLALARLGYSSPEIDGMIRYLLGTREFHETDGPLSKARLRGYGFSDSDLIRLEKRIPEVFELSSLFTRAHLGDALLQRLHVSRVDFENPDFNWLRHVGVSDQELSVEEARICGKMTLEGAPGIEASDLAVFDCANRAGMWGKRVITPMGHIRMMAAVQPFLSGAISKTVNLPQETSVQEIEMIHLMAWKLGLKSISVYRDGSKASQPLSAATAHPEKGLLRRGLPERRAGLTIEARVGGETIYLRTGEYGDGSLGEIFLDQKGGGEDARALLHCFAIAISLGLQYGVPLKEFVDRFTFTKFEPAGTVQGDPHIKMATSVIDYVFRTLGVEYLQRTELAHVSTEEKRERHASFTGDAIDEQLTAISGDAPSCDACGHSTVRNGSCFRCLHCGNSMGCS